MLPPESDSYFLFLVKILFIFSKIQDGWTVTKKEDSNGVPNRLGKFEFKKVMENGNTETMNMEQ